MSAADALGGFELGLGGAMSHKSLPVVDARLNRCASGASERRNCAGHGLSSNILLHGDDHSTCDLGSARSRCVWWKGRAGVARRIDRVGWRSGERDEQARLCARKERMVRCAPNRWGRATEGGLVGVSSGSIPCNVALARVARASFNRHAVISALWAREVAHRPQPTPCPCIPTPWSLVPA